MITDLLNNGQDSGLSDDIFGFYEGDRSTSYQLYITPKWEGTLTEHILNSGKKCGFTSAGENMVISFQGACNQKEDLPDEITFNKTKYVFSGAVLGNTVHAIAIVWSID